MKRIGTKSLLALMLVLAMTLLAACGTKKTETDDTASTDTTENTTTKDTATDDTDDTKSVTEEEQDAYAMFADYEFLFESGAGGWNTTLTIAADGSFTGQYHDSEMGETGDGYPKGSVYYCSFKGQLGDLEKVDDLTYKTTIASITYDNEEGTTEIKDEVQYIYSTAYGLDEAEDLYFYMPGTKTSVLSEGAMSWVGSMLTDVETGETAEELSFIVLYNEKEDEAFYSYDTSDLNQ